VGLAVDLGTTHTVAVVRRAGQEPRALIFDGSPLLPSGVFVDAAGTPHTGRDAQRLGGADPHRFEPHPKRRVDEGRVLLGEHEVAVEELLAAVLRRVADEARVAGVDPAGATLTCPADWGPPRRAVLQAAARHAGLGDVRLLDEPIAAATYCLDVLGQQVPLGGCLGIFDFGGGTFDVAVVRREPAGLRVLATGGLDDLGGLDVDSALVAHLGQLVAVRDADLWARLDRPADGEQRRDRQAFWAEVRAAKEMLSRSSTAPVHVPGWPEPMHLTRDELERLAAPLVARAVDETRRVLERAGVPAEALSGLLLVGGASRMPLVAARLHARLGVVPAVPEQPELPVAYGALVAAAPPRPVPGPAYPVSGPFGSPAAPYPVSGSFPGAPTSPGGAPPFAPRPPFLPPPPPPASGPVPAPRKPRPARRAVVLTVVFVLVGALVGGVVQGARWLARTFDAAGGRGTPPAGATGDAGAAERGGLTAAQSVRLAGQGAAAVTVAGDQVVYAVASQDTTEVVSLPAGGGEPKWRTKVPVEPETIRLTTVGDLIVLDGDRSVTDGGEDVRAVLAAGDGALRWKKRWKNRTDVAYLGTDALVEVKDSFDGNAVLRVDLRTGKDRWRRAGDRDVLVIDDHRIEPVLRWPDRGTEGGRPVAARGVLADAFTVSTDSLVELDADDGRGTVLDAANGKVRKSGKLPLDDEHWTAYGDLVIGVRSDAAAPVLAAYRLRDLTEAWSLRQKAGADIERVKPCGQHLVCAVVDEKTIAVDVRTGKQAWSKETDYTDAGWYATPAGLVFGDATFDTVSEAEILSWDGTRARTIEEFTSVEAVHGGRVALRGSRLDGNREVVLQVAVADVASGKQTAAVDVGADSPDQISLAGDVLAVLTADRQVLALTVTDLG